MTGNIRTSPRPSALLEDYASNIFSLLRSQRGLWATSLAALCPCRRKCAYACAPKVNHLAQTCGPTLHSFGSLLPGRKLVSAPQHNCPRSLTERGKIVWFDFSRAHCVRCLR
eukprot:1083900-Prorocentrum_minimum.AAC.2